MKKNKLTIEEKGIFCHEIAIILSSGMSIFDGLEIIDTELPSEKLKQVTHEILNHYKEHSNFYQAITACGYFDTYMEEMVKIGEESGRLDDVMQQLSLYYERNDEMISQLKDALTYPFILMMMMIAVIGILVVKILPIFQNVLLSLGTNLSPLALTLMNFGKQFALISFIILCTCVILFVLFYLYTKKHPENTIQDFIFSHFFATKKLYEQITLAHITYALSLFLTSGYPIEQAVTFLPSFVKHQRLKQQLEAIIQEMENGNSFEEALRLHPLYKGVYASLIQIGFKSGRQDEVMNQLVVYFEKDVANSISSFLNIIEPTIVAVLSFVVGIILLSVMLPLMGIMSSLG